VPIDVEKHLESIDNAVTSSAEKIGRIYGPAWAAKGDLAKILITVSSGLLAAILAFSKDFLEGLSSPLLYVALASMGGLLLTVVFSVASLYAATELSSFQARQFNRRPKLRAKLSELDETAPDFDSKVENIWKPMLQSDLDPVGKAANRATLYIKTAVGLFVASLFGFMVFVGLRYGAA